MAALMGAGVIVVAASFPAFTAMAMSVGSTAPSSAPETAGPPIALRAAAGGGEWERAYANAVPPAGDIADAVLAGALEKKHQEFVATLEAIAAEREAKEAAAAAAAAAPSEVQRAANARASQVPYSANSASGLAPGTSLPARVTIYGCYGPGGGFCGRMASGVNVFEGAAACSYNLPFGTRFTISGDPSGRTYECLDRGHLPATWVDVYFHHTQQGMGWQSNLGTTSTQITIVN